MTEEGEYSVLDIGTRMQDMITQLHMTRESMIATVGLPANVVQIQARRYGQSFHAAGQAIDITNQNMRVVPIPEGEAESSTMRALREMMQSVVPNPNSVTTRFYPMYQASLHTRGGTSDIEYYEIHKPEWPLVSDCCGTPNWVSAFREDNSGANDICLHCNKITKVVLMTVEHYNNMSENEHMSAEQFESMWTKRPCQE